ncbi:MAG: PxxKW family cysteine-rich protein [Thermodesulfobacteriota bacterium]
MSDTSMYTSGCFKTIVDKCEGCDRIVNVEENRYCRSYADPAAKWRLGLCNFATHAKPAVLTTATKINPLKASKRAAAGKKK